MIWKYLKNINLKLKKNNLNFFKTNFITHKTNSYFTINKIGTQLLMKLLFKPQLLIINHYEISVVERKSKRKRKLTTASRL